MFNLKKYWKDFPAGSMPALQEMEDAVNSVDNRVTETDARIDQVADGIEFGGTLDNIDAGTINKHFTNSEKTKLAGIAAGATVNGNAKSDNLTGTKNGVNLIFTFPTAPTSGTEMIFYNGVKLIRNTDYTLAGSTVTLLIAAPESDSFLECFYFEAQE